MKLRDGLIVFAAATCSLVMLRCIDNPQNGPQPLVIDAIAADSVIVVRDTLTVRIDTTGLAASTVRFCRLREGSWTIDTSTSLIYKTIWQFPDTGSKRIIVWAYDTAGNRPQSAFDTVIVRVRALAPEVVLSGDTTASVNDTFMLRAEGSDRDGAIDRFEWQVGGKGMYVTAASADSLTVQWLKKDTGSHVVRLWAIDNDGLRSASDSLVVRVDGRFPVCMLTGDTAQSINDTATITATGTDTDGSIVEYQWSIGADPPGWLSTTSGVLKKIWRAADTGLQVVRARVVDDDGYVSPPESLTVHVFAHPPRVTIDGLLQAFTDDTASFTARVVDDDGRAVRYDWSIETDTGFSVYSTTDSITRFVWTEENTGLRLVSVAVMDDDSLVSTPAVLSVRVRADRPVLVPIPDDTVSSRDTLTLRRALADTARRTAMFYWDFNGGEWDDSSASSERVVFFTGASMVQAICGVRDTAGRFFRDTTIITFNRPPVFDSLSLIDGDTVWMGERAVPGAFPFTCRVSDPEGEALFTTLVWNADTVRDTVPATLTVDTLGPCPWSVIVRDNWGNTTIRSGTVVIGREYTVCFAGHSIVAGVGSDGTNGGFRAAVLEGLRDSIGPNERVRAVGPLVTSDMGLMTATPKDDSCFAISGSLAREMLLLMDRAYTGLTADVWVLMLGVNGGFTEVEMRSTSAMVNRMFTRNPKARVYVLLSPPFSISTNVQRTFYNGAVRDSINRDAVVSWAAKGFAANIIRSDSLLALPTDSLKTNDSLFIDRPALHPNVEGYSRLGSEILRVMWSSATRVLPIRKED